MLSEDRLRNQAGEVIFGRGEDYVRYVHGLRVTATAAHASIQARNVYQVELDWSGADLAGTCTCPHWADGNFCKHLVATGLAVLDSERSGGPTPAAGPGPMDAYLDTLDAEQLRTALREAAVRDPDLARILSVRAAASGTDPAQVAEQLTAQVRETLKSRGFVDYRRSFDVSVEAERLLDELESALTHGGADVVRPGLLVALTRLRKITLTADDSAGVIGSACQRAADLYARSCREGNPDRTKLARWLAKFREDSPGWPETTLADFAPAFDAKALAVYRKAVLALDLKYTATDDVRRSRFGIDQMLLELADHDGDVDRAIELLSTKDHPAYDGIVQRLLAASRKEEAVAWIDRAVAAGGVSDQHGRGDYWLDPSDVAEIYHSLGRDDEAVEVLRGALLKRAGFPAFNRLLSFADRLGRGEAERAWALDALGKLALAPYGSGAALIEIAMTEGDLEAAWAAAEAYGPGHEWQRLAEASRETHPREAAELYLARVPADLTHPNTKLYPKIAQNLAVARDLYAADGDHERVASYVAEIRVEYARRTSLIAALDRLAL